MPGGKTPRKEWIWIDPAPKSTSPSAMNVLGAPMLLTSLPLQDMFAQISGSTMYIYLICLFDSIY